MTATVIPTPQAQGEVRFHDLDNYGLKLWSKWRSAKGTLVILVYRCRDMHGIAQEMELLDVQQEVIVKTHARDVVRWIQDGRLVRER
jgi:hypothetical protein